MIWSLLITSRRFSRAYIGAISRASNGPSAKANQRHFSGLGVTKKRRLI